MSAVLSCVVCAIFTVVGLAVFLFITLKKDGSVASTSSDGSSRNHIESLPGFHGVLRSKHHAGYLTVDTFSDSHLYYYFVESENNPKNDPLVLWLNGGPGCSSFDGFVYEHGPFKYDYNGGDVQLTNNPYTWAKVANIIYLDSPAGVGLSYSNNIERYKTDDDKTAADLHAAVFSFLELFPEYKANRFFVSGESYAGIYIPLLVHEIVWSNKMETAPHVNLIGYLIGNGVTDPVSDGQAFPLFAWGKSLISTDSYKAISAACDEKFWDTKPGGGDCYDLQVAEYMSLISVLNIYNVAGSCERPPPGFTNHDYRTQWRAAGNFIGEHGSLWPLGPVPKNGRIYNWRSATENEAPCSDYWTAEAWLNREDVRTAIYAAPIDVVGKFLICTDRLEYNKTVDSVFSVHSNLVTQHGMKALIFSGDHDMAVPHTGTELWTKLLNITTISDWQPWMDKDGQAGGFFVEYDGLTYCTVRNAGHLVAQTHPSQALEMFSRFLAKQSMADGDSKRIPTVT